LIHGQSAIGGNGKTLSLLLIIFSQEGRAFGCCRRIFTGTEAEPFHPADYLLVCHYLTGWRYFGFMYHCSSFDFPAGLAAAGAAKPTDRIAAVLPFFRRRRKHSCKQSSGRQAGSRAPPGERTRPLAALGKISAGNFAAPLV